MAGFDVPINLILSGGSKIDRIINKAAQLESIVNDINKKPLEVNVTKVTSAFDTLESNLKATRSTLLSQQKAADQAANSIDSYTNQIVDLQRKLVELNPNTKKYNDLLNKQNEAIRSRAAAEKEANASLERIEKTQRKLAGLEKDAGRARVAKEAAIAVENLADSYLRLGSAQQKSANESSIASLSAQAEALKLVANNSQVASSQFNRFAIATQAASQKIFEARQKQLGALAFGLSPEAPKVNIGRGGAGSIAGARGLVGSLIASGSEVVKSEAALSDYAERLRTLQSLVPYTSNEFRALEEAIAGVNQEISQIGLRGQKSAIQALSGPATDLGTTKAIQLRESFQKKVNDQLNLQDKIQERISQATLFDFQKKKLTLQLDEAVAALAENRLGDAQRLTREIDRQRISMERMNRAAQKPQVFGALGTAFMPVTGELPGGNVPGSPAAKAAEAKANRESTQAAVSLAKQKQKAIEDEAEELRKGTQAATALGKQKLKALQDEAERLRQETSNAVALAQQKMREEERAIAQAWKMRGGPELPPSMGGGAAGVRGQAFRAGGPGAATAALSAPKRVEALVRSAQLAQEKLLELEIRGVDVTGEKASVQKIINSLKEKDLQISDQLLNNADDELNLIRDVLRLEKQRLTNQRLLGGGGAGAKAGPAGTGLEQALKNLQEARGARQAFLGGASPAEAIDKIVREFNQGASTGGDQAAAQAAENVVGTYAQRITAGIPAVADAMMKLGKAGIDAIKKALGMASPSRVMLAIAKNQVDTYVDFLRAALPVVEAAAKSLGEAGTPKTSGVPESAIRKPITEKARTRPLTAEQLDRNSVIAEYAASQITGPMGQFEQVKRKIEDFIDKTRTSVDLDKLFGGQESERFAMATRGVSAGPEFDKLRSALADFYQVPAELTPDLERGVKTASKANASADELTRYVSELASGIEQIGVFLQSAAKLSTPAAVVDNEFTRAQEVAARADAAAAEAARKKAEAQKPFEASIERAAELDAEAKRKADAAVSSVVQAQIEADAKAGAEAISKSILDPIESAAPEGERQVRSAVGNLFDRVTGALGFGGGGGRPPVPPAGGGGGPTRDPGDFNRRLSTAAEQGAEALLGLRELRDPTKATTVELEALSGVLKEFRRILDPTVEGFDRLEKQLRESAANLDRQIERRAPEAGFLTRRFGPRTARGLSEGLIGGAFPLLFGQGVGAAAGGGLGGALGGFAGGSLGFGLSLVGTALGTAFDTLSQAAQDTGKSLNYPIESFEKLKEAGLFAGRQQEYYVSKLIESGRTAEAAAKIQARVVEIVGVQGANDLMELGDSASLLSKRWSELNYQIQALIAGPVGDFLGLLAKVAGAKIESNKMVGLGERISRLTPEQRKTFGQEAAKLSRAEYFGGGAEAILNRIAPQKLKQTKEDLAQEEKNLNRSLEVAEKVRTLRQQGIDVERSGQDLRLNIENTVHGLRRRAADMERESAEFRRSVEDQVFAKRQELEQKLIENDRKRQQNLIEAFDIQLQKASTGLDPIAQGVVEAARQYLRVRAEGEADLQQNEKQFKLQLQQIDQEVNRYKLQVEDRVSQMTIQREEFVRDVSKTKLELERQIGDYVIKVEEYRLEMARRRYDLAVEEGNISKAAEIAQKEGLGVPASGRNYANVGGFVGGRQMLHGIPGFAGYDPSHASETNIHYHFAGKNPAETKAVAEYLRSTGYQITEFGGFNQKVGTHAKGSQHYANNAFDIPGASMEGRGGMADIIAGQKRVHALILDFLGARGQQTGATGRAPGVAPAAPTAPTAPTMPQLPSAPQLISVNDLMSQYANLQVQIKKALEANNQEEARRLQLQSESARLAYEQQALSPLLAYQEQNRELEFEIQKRQIRNRLLAEGVRPEIVDGELRVLEINRTLNSVLQGLEVSTNEQVKAELERLKLNSALVDSTFRLTEATIASLVATTQDVDKQEELRKKLQEILDLRDRLAGKAEDEAGKAAAGARGVAEKEAKPGQKLQDFIAQATAELNDLEAVAVRVSQGIGDAVANSMANGITGLIEGTTTAKEIFADFLKDVGDILIKEGTRMIAMYIAIGVAKMFAGLFSSAGNASKPALPGSMGQATKTGLNTGAGNISDMFRGLAADGAYFANGVAAFARGGMFTNSVVSSPTLFKFADGGAMKTGVMGEAGPEAIMPLRRSVDGRLGVEASGLREAMGSAAGSANGSPTLNMSFETTNIGGVEYVSRDQLEAAMAATRRDAARDGAKRGMSMTLDKLQQSPGTRGRIGLR